MAFYEILLYFFIYAFLGWCLEVAYVALVSGRFVNRGFLNGAYCPIYGFGALILIYFLTPLKDNLLLFFAASVALTSLLELVVGFLLEKLFHQRWWDYSDKPLNFKGYICPLFSLLWGIACLVVVGFIHPPVEWLVGVLPYALGIVILVVLSALMAVDLTATVRTIAKINRDLGQIDELAARMRKLSDELGEDIAHQALAVSEKGSDLKEGLEERTEELKNDLAEWKDELEERTEELKSDLAEWKDELTEKGEEFTERIAERVEDIKEELEERRDDLTEAISELKEDISERLEEAKEKSAHRRQEQQAELHELREKLEALFTHADKRERRMLRAFPRMKSLRHSAALERLRSRLSELGEEKETKPKS